MVRPSSSPNMTADTEFSFRPRAAALRQQVPVFKISLANALARRGQTPKGDSEVRVFAAHHVSPPRVIIRKSSRTGFLAREVKDAVEMGPFAAGEIAKAVRRACKIAEAEPAAVPSRFAHCQSKILLAGKLISIRLCWKSGTPSMPLPPKYGSG